MPTPSKSNNLPPSFPYSLIERFISRLPTYPYSNHAQDVIRALTLVSATVEPTPRSTSRFTVLPAFTNAKGTLHGGAAAMIFDMCTSSTMALVQGKGMEGWGNGGAVSRSLNVVYLEGVKEGEEVLIESEVVKAGKRLGEIVFWKSSLFTDSLDPVGSGLRNCFEISRFRGLIRFSFFFFFKKSSD